MLQRIHRAIFVLSWLRLLAVVVYTRLLRLFTNPLFRRWLKIMVAVHTALLGLFRNQLFRKCLRILAGVGLFCLGVVGVLLPFLPAILFFIPGLRILFGIDIIQIAKRIIRRWGRCGRTPGA
ncbi:MAG: hypothetical protein AMS15_02330 [Planctomycetes bacterium DG_23]|nr:MAG: hypothetical protein AMS15_02330 [Planctomycetes bacterium DG_23]